MQDFSLNDLAWVLGSLLCVSIIGILWTQRAAIVSIVSGQWRASLERARQQKAARDLLYGYAEPEPLSSNAFPLLNDAEPYANGSGTAPELYLNEAEVAALQRMIRHNATAAKPSKSSTIQAGFGVSRGGSAAYTRASLIYDALFGAPAPAVKYRQRTPEQEALRQQLRLEKH